MWVAFNNATNALKSLGSFIGTSLGCDQVKENVQALLGRERVIVRPIGGGSSGVGRELVYDRFNGSILSKQMDLRRVELGDAEAQPFTGEFQHLEARIVLQQGKAGAMH